MMLNWMHRRVPRTRGTPIGQGADGSEGFIDTWHAVGGDAMVVIALKPEGYELIAWWLKSFAPNAPPLTPKEPLVYASLEEAQEEAYRLVFSRVDDWSRLLEFEDVAP